MLGIVWDMTEKPGLGGSIAAVVVGYATGVVATLPFTRAPAVEAEPAAEATG